MIVLLINGYSVTEENVRKLRNLLLLHLVTIICVIWNLNSEQRSAHKQMKGSKNVWIPWKISRVFSIHRMYISMETAESQSYSIFTDYTTAQENRKIIQWRWLDVYCQ